MLFSPFASQRQVSHQTQRYSSNPSQLSWGYNRAPRGATGISNASIEQIDTARRVLGDGNLASVQNEFSPRFRASEPELAHCAGLGIAFLPWSPLGGIGRAAELGTRHAAFGEVASAHGVSPQQVTLAWMLALAPVVIPIPGASRPESITDSARAADLALTPDELRRLGSA